MPSISILGSGGDTEYFHEASLNIANGVIPLSEGRTYYVNFLSGLYFLFGDQRILAQFLNVLLWVFSVIYLLKTLEIHEINKDLKFVVISIFSFFPTSLFMSSILLRESLIIFFITLSLFYFFNWYHTKKLKDYLVGIILAMCSMIFHSGMIGFTLAYVIALLFSKNKESIKRNNNNLLYLVILIIFFFTLNLNEELFLGKFNNLQLEEILSTSTPSIGSSNYLQSFSNLHSYQFILIIPLKIIYFYFAPLPMDWRGVTDAVSFLFDSFLYVYLLSSISFSVKKSKLDKKLKVIILIILFISSCVFALGTVNAGTAMRHRYKLLPILLIIYSLLKTKNKSL